MHPILFEVGGWPRLLLRRPAGDRLPGAPCSWPSSARGARGLDGRAIMDLGIYLIIAALVGAKLMLVVVDFDYFVATAARATLARRAGGVFYGGLIPAVARRRSGCAPVPAARCGPPRTCSRPASRWATSSGGCGCLLAGLLLRQADRPCRGPSRSPIRWRRRTSARRSACRSIRRSSTTPGPNSLILIVLLVFERRGRPFAGRTFWLYVLLYGVSRFIIEFFRGDDRGMLARHLHLAVRVPAVRCRSPWSCCSACGNAAPHDRPTADGPTSRPS